MNKSSHGFVPLDYCVKCREPEYDPHGYQTHPVGAHDFMHPQKITKSHKFISGIRAKRQVEKKRQKRVFTYIGVALMGTAAIAVVSTLFS